MVLLGLRLLGLRPSLGSCAGFRSFGESLLDINLFAGFLKLKVAKRFLAVALGFDKDLLNVGLFTSFMNKGFGESCIRYNNTIETNERPTYCIIHQLFPTKMSAYVAKPKRLSRGTKLRKM